MQAFNHIRDCLVNTNVVFRHRTITNVKTLADRLKFARELRGLSQKELGRRIGQSQSAIGNIEAGTRQSLRLLVPAARALGVSVDWLYDGKGPAPTAQDAPRAKVFYITDDEAACSTAPWPLKSINLAELSNLPPETLQRLDDFIAGLLAAGTDNPRTGTK